MTAKCRAKDPSACRVHGPQGAIAVLLVQADKAVRENRINDYFALRDQMNALTDLTVVTPTVPVNQSAVDAGWNSDTPDTDVIKKFRFPTSGRMKADAERWLREERHFNDEDIIGAQYFDFGEDPVLAKIGSDAHPVHVRNMRQAIVKVGKLEDVVIPEATSKHFLQRHFNVNSLYERPDEDENYRDVNRWAVKNFLRELHIEAKNIKNAQS